MRGLNFWPVRICVIFNPAARGDKARHFRHHLNEIGGKSVLKAPKWPFLLGQILLLGFAYFIVAHSPHPISKWEIIACFAAAVAGVLVGVLPFLVDCKLIAKKIEGESLGAVAAKIQDLEQLAAQ